MVDAPLLFQPGQQASYSNTNYLLLGMLMERLTGQTDADAIQDRIIGPLGLHATTLPGTDPAIHGPHAHGYMPVVQPDGSAAMVDVTRWNPTLMNAAGDIISTTRDLNRFYSALFSDQLLPSYLVDQMRTPALESIYGLGVIEHQLPCGAAWGQRRRRPRLLHLVLHLARPPTAVHRLGDLGNR